MLNAQSVPRLSDRIECAGKRVPDCVNLLSATLLTMALAGSRAQSILGNDEDPDCQTLSEAMKLKRSFPRKIRHLQQKRRGRRALPSTKLTISTRPHENPHTMAGLQHLQRPT